MKPRKAMVEESRPNVFRKGQTIYFFDEINNITVAECIKLIQEFEEEPNQKNVQLVLNSPGGDMYDGLALYDKLRNTKKNIVIIGTGIVASMATIVFLAGDKRYITENCRIMHHQGRGSFEGTANDIEIEASEFKNIEKICIEIMSERTGQDVKKFEKEELVGNRYLTSHEAVNQGFAHRIIQNPID